MNSLLIIHFFTDFAQQVWVATLLFIALFPLALLLITRYPALSCTLCGFSGALARKQRTASGNKRDYQPSSTELLTSR